MAVTTIGEALRYVLVNDSAVSAITSRCYPASLPQNPTYPLILYYHISGTTDNHLRGSSGMARVRYQIESWAKTYAAAQTLAAAVRVALNNYSGTVNTVRIGSCLIESERDIYEETVSCNRVIQDFVVWFDE